MYQEDFRDGLTLTFTDKTENKQREKNTPFLLLAKALIGKSNFLADGTSWGGAGGGGDKKKQTNSPLN